MRQKIYRGFVISGLILTVLSLMFFVGLMVYNIRRVILIQDSSGLALFVSIVLVLISTVLILAIVIHSFLTFLTNIEVDHKQYMNMLYLLIVFRLIIYVFFSMVDYRLPNQVTGVLGEIHYLSYVFVYRTDILPVSVFTSPSMQFMHSLMGTDLLSVGAVILGFSMAEKYKYAPLYGAVLGIIINFVFITIINVQMVNEFGTDFLFYKVDAVFTTLLLEFAMLGYVMYRLYEGPSVEIEQK